MTKEDPPWSDNVIIIVLMACVVFFGMLNRVTAKLFATEMQQYANIMAPATAVMYVLVYYSAALCIYAYRRRGWRQLAMPWRFCSTESELTPELVFAHPRLRLLRHPHVASVLVRVPPIVLFLCMGCCDALSSVLQLIALPYVPSALSSIIPQAVIVYSLVVAAVVLNQRSTLAQVAAAVVVVAGAAVCAVQEEGNAARRRSESFMPGLYVGLLAVAYLPNAISFALKELIFKQYRCSVFAVNSAASVWQLVLSLPMLPLAAYLTLGKGSCHTVREVLTAGVYCGVGRPTSDVCPVATSTPVVTSVPLRLPPSPLSPSPSAVHTVTPVPSPPSHSSVHPSLTRTPHALPVTPTPHGTPIPFTLTPSSPLGLQQAAWSGGAVVSGPLRPRLVGASSVLGIDTSVSTSIGGDDVGGLLAHRIVRGGPLRVLEGVSLRHNSSLRAVPFNPSYTITSPPPSSSSPPMCSAMPVVFLLYFTANVMYNICFLMLIKKASAAQAFIATVAVLPAAYVAFLYDWPIIGADMDALEPLGLAGFAAILIGLIVYRVLVVRQNSRAAEETGSMMASEGGGSFGGRPDLPLLLSVLPSATVAPPSFAFGLSSVDASLGYAACDAPEVAVPVPNDSISSRVAATMGRSLTRRPSGGAGGSLDVPPRRAYTMDARPGGSSDRDEWHALPRGPLYGSSFQVSGGINAP